MYMYIYIYINSVVVTPWVATGASQPGGAASIAGRFGFRSPGTAFRVHEYGSELLLLLYYSRPRVE